MLHDSENQQLVDSLKDLSGLVAIYLHGSMARGCAREESDIDLALLFRHDILADRVDLLYRSGELEAKLGRRVHLAVLSNRQLVFAKEVIAHGHLIFCRDRYYCDCFAMRVLADYADFKQMRKPVTGVYGVDV
jgi:uncharacterized protein